MAQELKILDVVALADPVPERGLVRGQVGTVVEQLAPGVFEVEFSDEQGRTYATAAVKGEQLIVLHYEPVNASATR
jgi:membrane protein implicated in regulation of membrane protease activity